MTKLKHRTAGLGTPVATSVLRPEASLSQRQQQVQAYMAGVGRHCLPVSSIPSRQGGISSGLKLLPWKHQAGGPNSRFNSVLSCIVLLFCCLIYFPHSQYFPISWRISQEQGNSWYEVLGSPVTRQGSPDEMNPRIRHNAESRLCCPPPFALNS